MPSASDPPSSPLDKYWKGQFWVLSSVIFRVIVGIGSSIVFVRYLGDTGYGSVVLMADFVTLAIVLLSMGQGVVQTRVLPKLFVNQQFGEAKDFLLKTIALRLGLSLVMPAAIFPYLTVVLKTFYPGVPYALMEIALILIPIQMITICFRGALESTYAQKAVSLGDMAALVLRLFLVVPVIAFDLGLVWFFVTQALADVCVGLFFAWEFRKRVWVKIVGITRIPYKDKIVSPGVIMMLTLLCGRFLGKEMDTQILSYRLKDAGLSEIAMYSVSFMIVLRSLSFIGIGSGGISNLNQVMLSELFEKKDFSSVKIIYSAQLQIFYLMSIPLIFGALVLAEPALTLMYGQRFAGSGTVCVILFLGLGGTVINYINYPVLYVSRHERTLLFSRSFFGSLNVVLSFFLAEKGAVGVAAATGFSLFGIAVFESVLVRRVIDVKLPFRFLAKTMAASAIMAGVVLLVSRFEISQSEIFSILCEISVGVVSFFLIVKWIKPIDYGIFTLFSGLPEPFYRFLSKILR